MKKIYALLLTLTVSALSFGQVFYSENMGTPAGTTPIASHTFQNSAPIVYSGTGTARTTTPSTGYTGASASGNIFLSTTTGVGHYFQIDGLDTSAYSSADIQLSFGYLTNTTGSNQMVVEHSTNGGTTWTPVTFPQNTTGNTWTLVTVTGGQIPQSATLSLRFTNPATSTVQMRLDDVKLTNVSASCTFAFGTPTTACDAETLTLDTYTATIPFTGAGNATYNINTTSGTVSGDNPTSVAAGNIVITGITEGTNITVTVTGGTCNIGLPVTSPECKVESPLPFNEPFNYTAGTALSTTQPWTNHSVGADEILTTAGNLNYSGITPAGNSATFSGAGSDTKARFTNTTSGTIFSSFIVKVTDFAAMADGNSTYFGGFIDNGNTFRATIWIRRAGTEFQFGVSPTTTSGDVVWSPNLYTPEASDLFNTQYLSLGYDFGTNLVTLVENPVIGGAGTVTASATPATAYSSIAAFFFRQDNNPTPTIMVDALKIDTTPDYTLGTSSFDNISGLNIYPNPANDFLNITTAANGVKNIAIYDVVGKEVVNTTTSSQTINVSSLNAGIYMVKITEEGKTATRKLVIK